MQLRQAIASSPPARGIRPIYTDKRLIPAVAAGASGSGIEDVTIDHMIEIKKLSYDSDPELSRSRTPLLGTAVHRSPPNRAHITHRPDQRWRRRRMPWRPEQVAKRWIVDSRSR
jgi:hypothetical protein